MNPITKHIVICLLTVCSSRAISQDLSQDQKLWYSSYLYFKLNNKFFVDDYILNGYNAQGHSFSFVQNDLNLNYRITKKMTVFTGMANYIYQWNSIYNQSYAGPISRLGTISYLRGNIGLKFKCKIFKTFEMDQSLAFQTYYPSLEKYQSRVSYSNQLSFVKKGTPLSFSPFVQMGLFYYLNGIPSIYYDKDGNYEGYYSSNGIHRIRLKFGLKMKPFKKQDKFGMVLYYCIQKEININGFGGHDLNTSRPAPITTPQTINYPFNNYNILGVQFNFIFS